MKSYKDLVAWQKSRLLVADIYAATETFPKEENFGLKLQIRRAAVSIPSNIAEGYSRGGVKDYAHFISIAIGSASELETQIILANDLNFINSEKFQILSEKTNEVLKLLHGLRKALKNNS